MKDHNHKLSVFITEKQKTSFLCKICFKRFNYIQAIDYVDKTVGLDEWRRLRSFYENFKRNRAKENKLCRPLGCRYKIKPLKGYGRGYPVDLMKSIYEESIE